MRKISFIFPGQGSQYIGMGKTLYDNFPYTRVLFEEAANTLNYDIGKLCFSGDMKELTMTENTQPAILMISAITYKVIERELKIRPDFMCGHSLGEYTALVCAGVIDYADALKIVKYRGKVMQECVFNDEYSMVSVNGLSLNIIDEVCYCNSNENKKVVVSNYNSKTQTVISGSKDIVDKVVEELSKLGAKCIYLKVSAPFHSPYMENASKLLNVELHKYKYNDFENQVISNFDAIAYKNKNEIIPKLTKQMVCPVMWNDTINNLINFGVDCFIELGPKSVLSTLIKKDYYDVESYAFDNPNDQKSLFSIFSRDII